MKKNYTEKQWQMRHMLNDVVDHFSKSPKELRSRDKFGSCLYDPPSDKPKSIGCAIGMYLPTKICKQLDSRSGTSIDSVLGSTAENLLPKWMTSLNGGFLYNLQQLHDTDSYWSKNGLTPSGEMAVREMIDEFYLPETIYG